MSETHKAEVEVLNPYCTYCGEIASKCNFSADVKEALISIVMAPQGPLKATVDIDKAKEIVLRQVSGVKLVCNKGHIWERDFTKTRIGI